jgi:D-erythrulose 4-phosphate isomerase
MKIALGADGVGKPLLDVILAHLAQRQDVTAVDLSGPPFYAEVAEKVGKAVVAGEYDRGILFCGTGIGVSISANKVPGIRAALTHDAYSAERAAKSNNAQIITMGSRVVGPEHAKYIVDVWLGAAFDPAGPSAANVAAVDRLDAHKRAGGAGAESNEILAVSKPDARKARVEINGHAGRLARVNWLRPVRRSRTRRKRSMPARPIL